MAVGGHIDPRLAKRIVAADAAFRNRFCKRGDKNLLRAVAVVDKTLQRFGAEILFVLLPLTWQNSDQGNAEPFRYICTEQIGTFSQRTEHDQLRVRTERLQLLKFRFYREGKCLLILFPDLSMPCDSYDQGDRVVRRSRYGRRRHFHRR